MNLIPSAIQIGSIVFDEAALAALSAVLLAILGVLGKHFSSAIAERRKMRMERENSRRTMQKQALELALSWLDSLDRAIDANLASYMASQRAAIRQFCDSYDRTHIHGYRLVGVTRDAQAAVLSPVQNNSKCLPSVVTTGALQEISKLQPSESLRAFLPDDLYLRVHKMASQVDSLYVTPKSFGTSGPYVVGALLEFRSEVDKLRKELKRRYLNVVG